METWGGHWRTNVDVELDEAEKYFNASLTLYDSPSMGERSSL